jgi:hypothetical protein
MEETAKVREETAKVRGKILLLASAQKCFQKYFIATHATLIATPASLVASPSMRS